MNPFPRKLEHLTGTQSECLQRAQALIPDGIAAIWISTAPTLAWGIPANKAHTLLGQETDAVVFDAHSGFDANALAAVSGTLRGGGTLYLLTPPLTQWAAFPDPDYRRFLPYPYQPTDVTGRFLQRFVGMLKTLTSSPPLPEVKGEQDVYSLSPPTLGRGGEVMAQQDAVAIICQANAPVVLTADRGRGKSAALGMAASHLITQGKTVLLTAPSKATVTSVFNHAIHPPLFFAPDDLLQSLPSAEVLLVDEAAAIPVPLLLRLLEHYPRCVFATTLHGYEGSGRGFALRFQQQLETLAPGWRAVRLHQPIRWADNDPLEHFINQALLLDVDLAPLPDRKRAGDGFLYHSLDRDSLAQNEPLLRQLFGLLVTAHYQTRPSDLRQMLDAPDISIHTLEQQGVVVAVALLSREGGLDTTLTAAIHAGTRRPHGHPIPQTLTFHAKIPTATALMCERVMRIAVHPEWQNHGLGTQLLEHLLGFAAQQGADYMGVSYAMTPALLRFWERAGFITARIGHRKDTASGSRSVVQIKALTAAGKNLATQCTVQLTNPV